VDGIRVFADGIKGLEVDGWDVEEYYALMKMGK
jgi:TPP-dependent pyruvate/acetoin dehydrogenase alpha subunit